MYIVCAGMYVCGMHVCVCVCVCVCVHGRMYVCVCLCVCMHLSVCMHTSVYVCVCVCIAFTDEDKLLTFIQWKLNIDTFG